MDRGYNFTRPFVGSSTNASSSQKSYQGMSSAGFLATSGMDAITATMQYGMNARKRLADEDELLEEEEEVSDNLAYTPAPGSPGGSSRQQDDDEEEDDPLDAYMAGIEVQKRRDLETSEKHAKLVKTEPEGSAPKSKSTLGRTDIDAEDDQESYFQWVQEQEAKQNAAGQGDEEEEEYEYDEQGNPIKRRLFIDPLPPIDHTKISYEPFEKNFYIEHENIAKLNTSEVGELRKKLGITVSGPNPPKPVVSFAHFGFEEELMRVIRKSEYSQPTPIQAQAIPVAMSGRDVIGIAQTGSGKTAAYVWPAIVHVMDQRHLVNGEGPIALICVPTRELALQVYAEVKRFAKPFNIDVICAYGGGSKWEQSKALQEGAEIVVCTPGRIIDHVKIKATNFTRVSYVVFDEADRMFDLGFEPQVRSIADHVRPDRQCLMFSATFKKKIERLVRDVLTDPIRIMQGELGKANEDVTQLVINLKAANEKFGWLIDRLAGFCTIGKVLIFVSQRMHVEELANNLTARDHSVVFLHGDMMQHERNEVIRKYKTSSKVPILVATDVAARGLDIPTIRTVVNYDVARDIDSHVHRIGRTGRAGEKGTAYTLVTDKDSEFAGHLVRNLEAANQHVPLALVDLAMKASWFTKQRSKLGGPGKRPTIGGRGLGFKEKKCLTASDDIDESALSGASSGGFAATATGIREALNNVSSKASGTNRLTAMREAFSAGYKSTFHSASAETTLEANQRVYTTPNADWKAKVDAIRKGHFDAGNPLGPLRSQSEADGVPWLSRPPPTIPGSLPQQVKGVGGLPPLPAPIPGSGFVVSSAPKSEESSSSSSTRKDRKRSRWD